MRIQHNITAMNSLRNFTTNNSSLAKNLEKLSSGYKINRAGDDAAGLAISEKMRAQITGLEGATKNAKDGISLIQTAEGALTEVHSMLNRMVTLTEQSANGTYDNEVDRAQLQKEVDALKTEIDRVADSTNFNGLKLLDGSLSGGGTLKGAAAVTDTIAVKASVTTTAFSTSAATGLKSTNGDNLSYTLTWKDTNGNEQTSTVKFTLNDDNNALVAADGTKYALSTGSASAGGTVTAAEFAKAVKGELAKMEDVNGAFNMEVTNDNKLKFTSKVEGTGGAKVEGTDTKLSKAGNFSKLGATELDETNRQDGKDVMQKFDLTGVKVLSYSGVTGTGDTAKAINDNTFEVDGKKFVLLAKGEDYDKFKKIVNDDVNIIQMENHTGGSKDFENKDTNYVDQADDAKKIAAELSRITGRDFTTGAAEDPANKVMGTGAGKADFVSTDILLKGSTLAKNGKGLTLQIGDTSEKFNKMSVTVADMHVKALGLTDVDISTQEGASEALDKIKVAVNLVSDTRGGLGALQNRLDHTINNLGVMRENIQNAESAIRDTDVAEEMMLYTKNNILNQSAQSMLAQANQLPQGVLQLLG